MMKILKEKIMSQVLIGSQSKNFKALEEHPPLQSKDLSSSQRETNSILTMTQKAQEKIFTFSSPKEWRASLRDQITEIGQTDPQKASRLSQKILLYQGRQGEIEELQEEGLEVSSRPHFPGLPGGMMGGEDLVLDILKGTVQLMLEGNKQEVRNQKDEQFIDARVQLPNGEWIMGKHEGGRALSKPKRSFKTMCMKKYHLVACGQGKFISRQVKYEGDFYENLFHDLTGEAHYFINQESKYTGCFNEGKRSGHGTLEKYSRERGEFYLYYRGTWREDQPETGTYFSQEGEEIAIVRGGNLQGRASSGAQGAPSQIPDRAVLSSAPPTYEAERKETVEEEKASQRTGSSGQRTRPLFEEETKDAAPTHQPSSPFKRAEKSSSPSPTRPRPNTPLRRQSSTNFDPTIPPEVASPLLAQKLRNPHQELSIDESIQLLTTCVKYGNERAQNLQGKEGVIVIGNTGAGKSTMVNYLAGCTMELKSPKELGFKGIKKIVTVRSRASGGSFDEIMPIGHTKESKTFMPQIETDPDQRFTYCDCPGFLDNRGAEINIANAVNVRTAITRSQSVKVVILINYHSLMADRGRGLSDMLKICSNLFGHADNLELYKESLLLGISQAPLDMELDSLKEWIVEDTPPMMQSLAERIFIFDPLERPLEGGWDRDACLSHLETLAPIENPSAIFKTVLTDSDERKLLEITEQMGEQIQSYLQEKNFASAASRLRHLQNLSVIEHITVERLLNQNVYQIGRFFQKTVDDFKTHCNFEHFSSAETLMQELQTALEHFEDDLEEVINISRLENYYQETQIRYQERVERERAQEEALKKAQGQVEELLHLLEEQKQTMQQQLKSQEEKFQGMLQEMQNNIEATQSSYSQMQETLRQEMNERLAQKDEELSLAQSLSQEARLEIEQSRARLEAEYAQKLKTAEQEKAQLLQAQEAEKAQRAQEMAEQNARAEEKIRAIEAQQAQKVAELQSTALPRIAFGKAEWERYFGEVGEQPPLPADIGEILSGPCPYWEGRRVEDTHMLVLIPETVNGAPLTLNSLKELIQRPLEGGHNTDYRCYEDNIKNELGDQGASHSYWALMTKDVLPNSRNKTFSEQQALIQGPYVVPGALEAATAILMHHAKGGEKLYPQNPNTYTRCQEKVSNNLYRVLVGSFGPAGLDVSGGGNYFDCRFVNVGLGGLRKF